MLYLLTRAEAILEGSMPLKAGVLFVPNGGGIDAVFIDQRGGDLRGIDAVEGQETDAAGLRGVGAVQNLALWILRQAERPVVAEVAETRGLAIDADVVVEDQGVRDGVQVGGGMGADLFELADVVFLGSAGGHERPGGGDAGFFDIEETR